MAAKIGLVVSDFNKDLTSQMEEHAVKKAKSLSLEVTEIIHVPGGFEIPLAAKKLFVKESVDAVAVLGVVIQGDTNHDVVIMDSISPKLLDLSLESDKPLGFGIIGPRVSREKAEERVKEYAERAVQTAFEMLKS